MNDLVLSSIPISELEILIDNAVTRAMNRQTPTTESKSSQYITRAQVCKILHISLPTAHIWMKEGKLKPYHIGGRTLFKEGEVLEAVKPVNYSIK